jgi:hypothetical protein
VYGQGAADLLLKPGGPLRGKLLQPLYGSLFGLLTE